jgi:hypothetical protein
MVPRFGSIQGPALASWVSRFPGRASQRLPGGSALHAHGSLGAALVGWKAASLASKQARLQFVAPPWLPQQGAPRRTAGFGSGSVLLES